MQLYWHNKKLHHKKCLIFKYNIKNLVFLHQKIFKKLLEIFIEINIFFFLNVLKMNCLLIALE